VGTFLKNFQLLSEEKPGMALSFVVLANAKTKCLSSIVMESKSIIADVEATTVSGKLFTQKEN
jgi:hypothetical protein